MSKAPIEIDGGVSVPAAFTGLRKVLQALQPLAPEVFSAAAARRPAEWNRLFPGSVQGAPELSDLALSPSERRLHRESEQTFWILNFGARLVLDALEASGRSLRVSNAGRCDLVSLRGLMRAVEWGGFEGRQGLVELTGWGAQRAHVPELFESRRRTYLDVLRQRMSDPDRGGYGGGGHDGPREEPVDLEGRYLQAVLQPDQAPERQVAAAILAMRSCFFTTNYEGAMLAAERGLAVLQRPGARLDPSAVVTSWDELDTGFTTPAIEIDRTSLGEAGELQALLHRCVGVVQAFTGEFDLAMESFARGLECELPPERVAQLRMYRALCAIKRLGQVPFARNEIELGLAAVAGRPGDQPSLHEGWLRNVYALIFFQEKKLQQALEQEKIALKCVGELHDPSATHLKINLISNVSVLQESAKQFGDSIATWRKFERISADWGPNFRKHHRYRLGGLTLALGSSEEASVSYEDAYQSAGLLGDSLHRQSIAAELGRKAWEGGGGSETAVEWFTRALSHAREVGDPLSVAQSLAGLEVARGGTDFGEALRAAATSTTYPDAARGLSELLSRGDGAEVMSQLPKPRTKLNRPFDLVNLT